MDVEGILAFAERVLPSAANLWVHSSLTQKRRAAARVFFPDGVRFDGKSLVGTGTTLPVFNYLNPISDGKKDLVDLSKASSNPLIIWLRLIEGLSRAA